MSVPSRESVRIEGPEGAIEAVVENGEGQGASFAVLCHPHPLYGGTMDNKVVTSVARALNLIGLPTVRFNFRGIGASAGTYDNGVGETRDAQAATAWGRARWPGKSVIAAGFSFGGAIATRLAIEENAARLITIAPAFERIPLPDARRPECPWLIVQGDADELVDPKWLTNWAAGLEKPPRVVMLAGVGHFFHGKTLELRAAVTEAFRSG